MPQKPSKNPLLAPLVNRFSRSAAFKRKHGWKLKKAKQWKLQPKKVEAKKLKEKPFGKGTRVLKKKAPRFYSEEKINHRLSSRKTKHHPTHLRRTITPGTVLILLAGRFRGSRVVFLRQLKSGLLLVNGPFKTNGVPLRRVNQAYVIATSTKLDISDIKIDEKFNDKYFQVSASKKKQEEAKKKKDAKKACKKDAPKKDAKKEPKKAGDKKDKKHRPSVPASRAADQKSVDALLVPKVKKIPLLKKYLRTKFSLKRGQYPHLLKF